MQHVLIELKGDAPASFADPGALLDTVRAIVSQGQKIAVEVALHPYEPIGHSMVVRSAWACVVVHTWPEHAGAAIDLFCFQTDAEGMWLTDVTERLATHGHVRWGERAALRDPSAAAVVTTCAGSDPMRAG